MIESSLHTQMLGHPCIMLDEVDSTNADILRRAAQGADEGLTIMARQQSAGRGRLQRTWHTLPDDTLAMSILLKPEIPIQHTPQLSLLTAVALHKALNPLAKNIRIKWPNDILCQNKKLAGILTEMRHTKGERPSVVIGIGINIRRPDHGWPEDIANTATDLTTVSGSTISLTDAAARILNTLEPIYLNYLKHGFTPVREQWWQAHAASGKRVHVHNGQQYIEGIAQALDHNGALLLRTKDGIQRITTGDVSLHV